MVDLVRTQYADGHEQLSDMTLRMLGGMDDESQPGRRQLVPADLARFGERPLVDGTQLLDGAIDLLTEGLNKIVNADVWA